MYALTSEQMKQLDHYTIQQLGIAGPTLMEIAGNAVVMTCREQQLLDGTIAVLCGSGNNGGDGFVIARRLMDLGYDVSIGLAVEAARIKGDARVHYDILMRRNIPVTFLKTEVQAQTFLSGTTTIIDCLLGTGISGQLRGTYAWLIPFINTLRKRVIAVDIPSGLNANDGTFDDAIYAHTTITLAQPKIGFYLQHASQVLGEVVVADISVPPSLVETLQLEAPQIITEDDVRNALPKRVRHGHKGTFGHGAVIGGSAHYVGAPLYSAKAAFHSGIGLVSLVVPETLMPAMMLQAPESLLKACEARDGSLTVTGVAAYEFSNLRALAFGPGLGRAKHLSQLAEWLLAVEGPQTLIIDADGLYALKPHLSMIKGCAKTVIVTPHPGEMAMLCDTTVADIEGNRLQYATQFAKRTGAYTLLKGHRTIIATPSGDTWLLPIGDDALGKGGSGDVLTGLILSFVTQGATPLQAMQAASYIQAASATTLAERHSHYSVTPEMVIAHIGDTLRQFECSRVLPDK